MRGCRVMEGFSYNGCGTLWLQIGPEGTFEIANKP